MLILLWSALPPLLMGCRHDDTPVSPNEKTAAPARLPGEDPHAHPGPAMPNVKK